MKIPNVKNLGFTLIEMIVALGIFSFVVTIAVGSLLMLIATNLQIQTEQSIMTNLSFALDSMAREIRTGTSYYCAGAANYNGGGSGNKIFGDGENGTDLDDHEGINENVNDCSNGSPTTDRLRGISFIEGGDSITAGASQRILYYFDGINGSVNEGKLMRRVGNGPAQSIVSSGIYIQNAKFFASGTDSLDNGDDEQATVTIFIEAREKEDADKIYKIQTTITQRTLNI